MKRVSIFKYINLGGQLSYLRSVHEGYLVHKPRNVLDNINRFFKNIEESELEVTKNALSDLNTFKEKLEETEENYRLNKTEARALFRIMDKIFNTVKAESEKIFLFSVTEKRIDVNKLLNNVESLFAREVFNFLSDEIQYDFKESGKCIAYECPTASAFHVLRGFEGLLRELLNKLNPQKNTSEMNLGSVIRELKKLNIPDLRVLLDNSDRIRDNYRNPTSHPDKIFDIDEAQDLFPLCVGIVNEIISYMKKNNYI